MVFFGRPELQAGVALQLALADQKTEKALQGREFAADRALGVIAVQARQKSLDQMVINLLDAERARVGPWSGSFHKGEKLGHITQIVPLGVGGEVVLHPQENLVAGQQAGNSRCLHSLDKNGAMVSISLCRIKSGVEKQRMRHATVADLSPVRGRNPCCRAGRPSGQLSGL